MHAFLPYVLARLLLVQCTQNFLHKARFWKCSHNFNTVIDDGFRHSLYSIALSNVNELGDLYNISGNMLIFNCQLVGQPGRTGTIGSGWGHKDLHM
jgi:hypothetical protein